MLGFRLSFRVDMGSFCGLSEPPVLEVSEGFSDSKPETSVTTIEVATRDTQGLTS